jgi:hypothetical protein
MLIIFTYYHSFQWLLLECKRRGKHTKEEDITNLPSMANALTQALQDDIKKELKHEGDLF